MGDDLKKPTGEEGESDDGTSDGDVFEKGDGDGEVAGDNDGGGGGGGGCGGCGKDDEATWGDVKGECIGVK